MRMKSLLGLLAIGGAVAYAQKKRGGELSLAGFKKTFQDLMQSKMPNKMRASDDELPSYASSGRAGTATRSSYGSNDYTSGELGVNNPSKLDR